MIVGPDLERQHHVRAVRMVDVPGLAVDEQHPGPVLHHVAEAFAGRLEAFLPGVAQLVARGLREGVPHVPEALDEIVALVVAGQRQEDRALAVADQRRHLLEPGAVLGGEIGRDRRR